MVVFYKAGKSIIARPLVNVVQVVQKNNSITIYYHSGNFGSLELFSSASLNSDIVSDVVKYETEKAAVIKMREFYSCCRSNLPAFFF